MSAHHRSRWLKVIGITAEVLSVVLVVIVVRRAWPEIRDATQTLADANVLGLVAALALEVGAVLTLPLLYRACQRAVGHQLPYKTTLGISMSAFTLGRVIPGGGVAGAVYAARRMTQAGIPAPAATAAVGVQAVGQLASLGLVVAVVAIRAALRGEVSGPVLGLVAVATSVLALVPAVVTRILNSTPLRRGLERLTGRLLKPERAQRVQWWMEELASFPLGPRKLLDIGLWGSVNWLFEFGALWLVLISLGGDLKAGVLMLGFGVANVLTGLPTIPGGVGFVETGMAGTFVALGVEPALAISTVVIYRVVAFWLPVLAGLAVYLRIRSRTRQTAVQKTAESQEMKAESGTQ